MHSYLLQKLRTASISIFHKFSHSREKNHNNNLTQDIYFRLQDLKSRAHKIHEYFEINVYVLNVQLHTIEVPLKCLKKLTMLEMFFFKAFSLNL